jgi:hypothetical protein
VTTAETALTIPSALGVTVGVDAIDPSSEFLKIETRFGLTGNRASLITLAH